MGGEFEPQGLQQVDARGTFQRGAGNAVLHVQFQQISRQCVRHGVDRVRSDHQNGFGVQDNQGLGQIRSVRQREFEPVIAVGFGRRGQLPAQWFGGVLERLPGGVDHATAQFRLPQDGVQRRLGRGPVEVGVRGVVELPDAIEHMPEQQLVRRQIILAGDDAGAQFLEPPALGDRGEIVIVGAAQFQLHGARQQAQAQVQPLARGGRGSG